MTAKQKTVTTMAAAGAVVIAAAGVTAAAYNSRPVKMKRMIRRAGRAMDGVGSMLSDMAHMVGM
ncbi:MAG: hypothetical protein MJ102_05195 [Clostridia bacterium]|nr:hypothetical protein [Clostridia bacterium]